MSAPTLLELIAASPLDGSPWSAGPAVAPAEPEYASCLSRLRMLNGNPSRSAACVVLHDETGETAHSARVNGHSIFWTDAEAEIAEAWLGILPTCINCRARYRKSESDCGPYCGVRCQLADKHNPADNYEAVEAA